MTQEGGGNKVSEQNRGVKQEMKEPEKMTQELSTNPSKEMRASGAKGEAEGP